MTAGLCAAVVGVGTNYLEFKSIYASSARLA